MCQIAVKDHPWVSCSTWEIEQDQFYDFPQVVDHHAKVFTKLYGTRVKVAYLCGAGMVLIRLLMKDHALKCYLKNGIDGKHPVVCIDRPNTPHADELISWAKKHPHLFYFVSVDMTASTSSFISSTLVRHKVANHESVTDLVGKEVEKYLLQVVLQIPSDK